MRKLVLFGAGKIGRSFIGQLFSRSGYKVVFVDINEHLVRELNRRQQYNVIIKAEKEEKLVVSNVRAVNAYDKKAVAKEITDTPVIAVSVGLRGLPDLFPVLAEGLRARYASGNDAPVDIILAENMRNAGSYFRRELGLLLPDYFPLDDLVGLVETSIGKMVPIMLKKDIEEDTLQVFAEPYNTLIVDRNAFRGPVPEVEGLEPKENIRAWNDRKLFIHNLGHAAVAYYGNWYDRSLHYTWEALEVPEIHEFAKAVMMQASDILMATWPGEFSAGSLTGHIDDLLHRFRNKALGDTIYRVGCDLFRKLGPDDRIAGPIKMALTLKKPYDLILKVLLLACQFRAADENGNMMAEDIEFIRLYKKGLRAILTRVCGFDEKSDRELIDLAEEFDRSLLS
ncbi:MAG: hypothetical protein R6W81_10575 [Bacteroidales bacterium]